MNSLRLQKITDCLAGHPHWLLAGHLLILHGLAFGGWQLLAGRLLLPMAVGFLLLWQPFVEGERRLGWRQSLVLFLLVLALAQWLNPWLLLVWCGTLAALIGGRVLWTGVRRERIGYLLAFGYVLCLVILAVVPAIAPKAVVLDPLPKGWLGNYLWLLLPCLLFFPAQPPRRRSGDAFDFFYALLVFLLLAVFVLGSLAFMLIAGVDYLKAVLATSFSLAGALLLLAWLWNPQAGFAGLGASFARHLLSIGMPLEQWLLVLNEESEREDDPELFLQSVLARLLTMPWVVGGRWSAAGREGMFGSATAFELLLSRENVRLQLYFRHLPSPAMHWHCDWLLRLTAEFYLVKRQARELQRLSYLQAIYETGARVTHDAKNLLQSLQTLCYAAAQPGDPEALASLLGRQLPQIAERLKATLDKLQRPALAAGQWVRADEWWGALQARYAGEAIDWRGMFAPETMLPRELFDNVAENLLQNALFKRQQSVEMRIVVDLSSQAEGAVLQVEDNGETLVGALAEKLFREPVVSEQGLGIGLYHAARLADGLGYRLALTANRPGCVCFRLAPK